jgi:hypothetical protein
MGWFDTFKGIVAPVAEAALGAAIPAAKTAIAPVAEAVKEKATDTMKSYLPANLLQSGPTLFGKASSLFNSSGLAANGVFKSFLSLKAFSSEEEEDYNEAWEEFRAAKRAYLDEFSRKAIIARDRQRAALGVKAPTPVVGTFYTYAEYNDKFNKKAQTVRHFDHVLLNGEPLLRKTFGDMKGAARAMQMKDPRVQSAFGFNFNVKDILKTIVKGSAQGITVMKNAKSKYEELKPWLKEQAAKFK